MTATATAERTAHGGVVRWTEEEVSELCESDARFLMQMATLRSTPHDLFIIRWCVAHLRKLQKHGPDWPWALPIEYSDGTEPRKRPAP